MATYPIESGESTTYDHVLWSGSGRWRGVVAIILLIVSFFIVSTLITIAGVALDAALGNEQTAAMSLTPIALLAINLSLAAQIPIAVLLQRMLYGVRPGSLSSVAGRFRWRWLGRLALVIVPLYVVYGIVLLVIAPIGSVSIDAGSVALFLIVLISTPLQAAGEEYAVRGLVQRSASSWFRTARVALIVSTVVAAVFFATVHANSDPWQVAYYLVFGIAASIATWGTGGLEAGTLVHSMNNLVILAPIALTGGIEGLLARSGASSGAIMLVPMLLMLFSALVSVWLARRYALATRSTTLVPARAAEAS